MHASKSTSMMTMTALVLTLMLIAGCSMTTPAMDATPTAPAASADAPSAAGFSLAAGDALGHSLFVNADAVEATAIARND